MSDPQKVALLAALLVVLFALMWWGWRGRARRTAAVVPALPAVPALGAPLVGPVEATYLATGLADDRLARVAAHGLAVRAPADVAVHDLGVLVRRAGATDLFIPAADLLAVSRASGMAGTAVGADRVVVLRWRTAAVVLDTGLLPRRAADCAPVADAARALIGAGSGALTDGSPA